MFNTVKSITSSTSNGHPDHIIGNLFIRLQAEEQLGKSTTNSGKAGVTGIKASKISWSLL